jgi:hypothetical protein
LPLTQGLARSTEISGVATLFFRPPPNDTVRMSLALLAAQFAVMIGETVMYQRFDRF